MNPPLCRRCLLAQTDPAGLYQAVLRRIEQLPPDERATDAEYRARLAVCAECAELQNGICAQCGCFAELRAAKTAMYCPLRNW